MTKTDGERRHQFDPYRRHPESGPDPRLSLGASSIPPLTSRYESFRPPQTLVLIAAAILELELALKQF